MKSFKIAISGGCHSGKTTFIEKLQELMPDDIIISDEVIRSKSIVSIDDIRNDPHKYFEFEMDVIKEKCKVDMERSKVEDKIVLFDRSIIDSLFYITFYLGYDRLPNADKPIYKEFIARLNRSIHRALNELYDKIMFFEKIPIVEKSKFRPDDLSTLQKIESINIKELLNEFLEYAPDKIDFMNQLGDNSISRFIVKVQEKQLMNIDYLKDYASYKKKVDDLILFNTIMTNNFGSVIYDEQDIKVMVGSSLLYSTKKEDSDYIINCIKLLETDTGFMNSRCYPTGLFEDGNIMIVGEAPGTYGRAIKDYLKPAFMYAKTSMILRNSILHTFDKMPYITNLNKFAWDKNKFNLDDVNKCRDIFTIELDYIQPKAIIALGNNVYETLKTYDLFPPVIKVMHPTSPCYSGQSIEDYRNKFKKDINNGL